MNYMERERLLTKQITGSKAGLNVGLETIAIVISKASQLRKNPIASQIVMNTAVYVS